MSFPSDWGGNGLRAARAARGFERGSLKGCGRCSAAATTTAEHANAGHARLLFLHAARAVEREPVLGRERGRVVHRAPQRATRLERVAPPPVAPQQAQIWRAHLRAVGALAYYYDVYNATRILIYC